MLDWKGNHHLIIQSVKLLIHSAIFKAQQPQIGSLI